MSVALLLGAVLAVGALAVVLQPLFFPSSDATTRRRRAPLVDDDRQGMAVAALREIEFDKATGKLSDADYDDLKARYTERALVAMRASEASAGDDPVEAAVRALRATLPACSDCGVRPEPDAVYCSTCGKFLPGRCESCNAPVDEPGAHFCSRCGYALVA
ncbi:MAG: hypothetical protein JWO05_438 [Gemmatimonadetes bacterium]|nr:hypothetical protein [Gemmatimonadota bacterium]